MVVEEEVDLIDYLSVVWKRKAMIVWLFSLSVASAGLVAYVMKPTYELSRVLKIGRIGQISEIGQIGQADAIVSRDRHLIDTREAVIETITDQRLLEEVRAKILPEVPIERLVMRITVERKTNPQTQASTNVRYTVQGETPSQAVAVADAIAESIIHRHAKIFEEGMAVKQQYEEELKAKINVLTKEIRGMRITFDRIRANPKVDAVAIILLEASLEDRERNVAGLKHELRDVQLSNLPPMSANTRVIAADAMPTRPVKPKATLNMALAGALSLFTGIFLAFFLEYWQRINRERAEGARPAVP